MNAALRALVGVMAAGACLAAQPPVDHYWAYQYKEFDVVAAGDQRYAINLARNLDALDQSLVKLLSLDPNAPRFPTHIYALSFNDAVKVGLSGNTAVYVPGQFDNTIFIREGSDNDHQFYGANFGFVLGLLASQGKVRLPDWYQSGIGAVFAASTFKNDEIVIGQYETGHLQTLSGPLIPMRELLQQGTRAPEYSKSEVYRYRFEAQSWFLVHLMAIEGEYRKEFSEYLRRMVDGQSEAEAFMASFSGSYEDLDGLLQRTLKKRQLKMYSTNMLDISNSVHPQRLGDLQWKARLAHLAATRGVTDRAEKLAAEVLATDSDNEYALRALAASQLQRSDLTAAKATAARLESDAALSASGHDELGTIFRALSVKSRGVGTDEQSLYLRSVQQFRKAVQEDGDYPEAAVHLAGALVWMADTDPGVNTEIREFLPSLEKMFYRHPNIGLLAQALSQLNMQLGDIREAFKFAVAYESLARTEQQRTWAAETVAKLRPQVQQLMAAPAAVAQ